MDLRDRQLLEQLGTMLDELEIWTYRDRIPLGDWLFDGNPIKPGDRWPSLDGPHVFTSTIIVPDEWDLEECRLEVAVGGEALMTIQAPEGSYQRRFGVDLYHQRFPVGARKLDLRIEAVARSMKGSPRNSEFEQARLVWVDEPVEQLARQLRLVLRAIPVQLHEEVKDELFEVARVTFAALRLPSLTDPYVSRRARTRLMAKLWEPPGDLDSRPEPLDSETRGRVVSASKELGQTLEALRARYPQPGSIAMVGHTHIDLAWLWPIAETEKKVVRSFHTVADLMDRYPDFRFLQSEPLLYAFVEAQDPELFAEVQARVASGQWELVGGMWIEPDTNMPSGESFVRQLLYGQRYFQSRFGMRPDVAWLPDSFGFSGSLPQLFRGAGIRSFSTQKLRDADTNQFPYKLFMWEGIDGSQVLAHMYDVPSHRDGGGLEGTVDPLELIGAWQNFNERDLHNESLISIGFGDGGGGPTAEQIERSRIVNTLPGLPHAEFTQAKTFFDRAWSDADLESLPVWVGELYYELHRGTLTSQGRVKSLHRRVEHDLVAAELAATMNWLAGGPEPASRETDWRLLMRNQSHDTITGSSIHEVIVQAEAELTELSSNLTSSIKESVSQLAARLIPTGSEDLLFVVNPSLSQKPLRLEFDGQFPGAQNTQAGSVVAAGMTVPGLSASTLTDASALAGLSVDEKHMENDFVLVEFGDDGTLHRVYDKTAQREVLAERGNQLWVYHDIPRREDAWEIAPDYTLDGEELSPPKAISVIERGPHRAAIRVERQFRDSVLIQDVRLWANSPRIEFVTTLDWRDRHTLLKARFAVAVRSNQARFEGAFGVVERPTHRNTPWDRAKFEVAAHRFVDLAEPNYGVALLNNGKYGHHALGNELGISLLRAPVYPDPRADEGQHNFTYALYPHAGGLVTGGVIAEAEDLNRPLLSMPVSGSSIDTWQPIEVEGLDVALAALKPSEDGGSVVLRVYEPEGGRGDLHIAPIDPWRIDSEVNLLEEATGPAQTVLGPFQVRSYLLSSAG